MPTRRIRCTCISIYQDKRFGNRVRLHNESKDGNSVAWTCTVCGKKKLNIGR